jgi:hypothetical protein
MDGCFDLVNFTTDDALNIIDDTQNITDVTQYNDIIIETDIEHIYDFISESPEQNITDVTQHNDTIIETDIKPIYDFITESPEQKIDENINTKNNKTYHTSTNIKHIFLSTSTTTIAENNTQKNLSTMKYFMKKYDKWDKKSDFNKIATTSFSNNKDDVIFDNIEDTTANLNSHLKNAKNLYNNIKKTNNDAEHNTTSLSSDDNWFYIQVNTITPNNTYNESLNKTELSHNTTNLPSDDDWFYIQEDTTTNTTNGEKSLNKTELSHDISAITSIQSSEWYYCDVPPTTTYDSTNGYSAGNILINPHTCKIYVCYDATPNNAVWLEDHKYDK